MTSAVLDILIIRDVSSVSVTEMVLRKKYVILILVNVSVKKDTLVNYVMSAQEDTLDIQIVYPVIVMLRVRLTRSVTDTANAIASLAMVVPNATIVLLDIMTFPNVSNASVTRKDHGVVLATIWVIASAMIDFRDKSVTSAKKVITAFLIAKVI